MDDAIANIVLFWTGTVEKELWCHCELVLQCWTTVSTKQTLASTLKALSERERERERERDVKVWF